MTTYTPPTPAVLIHDRLDDLKRRRAIVIEQTNRMGLVSVAAARVLTELEEERAELQARLEEASRG